MGQPWTWFTPTAARIGVCSSKLLSKLFYGDTNLGKGEKPRTEMEVSWGPSSGIGWIKDQYPICHILTYVNLCRFLKLSNTGTPIAPSNFQHSVSSFPVRRMAPLTFPSPPLSWPSFLPFLPLRSSDKPGDRLPGTSVSASRHLAAKPTTIRSTDRHQRTGPAEEMPSGTQCRAGLGYPIDLAVFDFSFQQVCLMCAVFVVLCRKKWRPTWKRIYMLPSATWWFRQRVPLSSYVPWFHGVHSLKPVASTGMIEL